MKYKEWNIIAFDYRYIATHSDYPGISLWDQNMDRLKKKIEEQLNKE